MRGFGFLFALTVLVLCNVSSQSGAAETDRDLIPDSTTAIKVASAILETWMGKAEFAATIKEAPLRAELMGDTWLVSPYRPNAAGREIPHPGGGTTVIVRAGGGQPVVVLSKKDAQVREIYFSR